MNKEKEHEIYEKEVAVILADFLNYTYEDKTVVSEFTDRFTRKFALGQEQGCVVRIALTSLYVNYRHYGEVPDCFAGFYLQIIVHVLLKDWNALEGMSGLLEQWSFE